MSYRLYGQLLGKFEKCEKLAFLIEHYRANINGFNDEAQRMIRAKLRYWAAELNQLHQG